MSGAETDGSRPEGAPGAASASSTTASPARKGDAAEHGQPAWLGRFPKPWQHLIIQLPFLVVAGVASWLVASKLQALSGGALWMPSEFRQFVSALSVIVGLLGVLGATQLVKLFKNIPPVRRAMRSPEWGKSAAALFVIARVVLALGAVVATCSLYLAYQSRAIASKIEFQTNWGDVDGNDGLWMEYGGNLDALGFLQRLGPGNYLLRIPRQWPVELEEQWIAAAEGIPGEQDRRSTINRGLSAKLSAAPVEVIDAVRHSESITAQRVEDNAWFLTRHSLMMLCIGAAIGLVHNPKESSAEFMTGHLMGH